MQCIQVFPNFQRLAAESGVPQSRSLQGAEATRNSTVTTSKKCDEAKKKEAPRMDFSAMGRAEIETRLKEMKAVLKQEVTCPICKDLITDAVIPACCGNSGCEQCK